jgi:tRNA 2-thiocytidine biosynthesis protein TtcA
MRFPVIPCDLCGSQPNLRRRRVKALLAELSAEHPAVKGNLMNALGKVVATHLLDRELLARLGEARGRDPWLDEDADACAEASQAAPGREPERAARGGMVELSAPPVAGPCDDVHWRGG